MNLSGEITITPLLSSATLMAWSSWWDNVSAFPIVDPALCIHLNEKHERY